MLALTFVTQSWLLGLLLVCEGLALGAYIVSGQTFVADQTTIENRGTAVGLYAMAGSVGAAAAPATLGAVAERWGLAATFGVTGTLVAVGAAVVAAGIARGDPSPPSADGDPLPREGEGTDGTQTWNVQTCNLEPARPVAWELQHPEASQPGVRRRAPGVRVQRSCPAWLNPPRLKPPRPTS